MPHHELYHNEHSMNIAAVCNISSHSMSVLFYDLSLDRSAARSVEICCAITPENACAELSMLIFTAMRSDSIPASAVKNIGIAAPIGISAEIEESLDPCDMFLPPDVVITVLPFVSMTMDGRFAAVLAAADFTEGMLLADFGCDLNTALYNDGHLLLASMPLCGAFDGSGLDSGVPAEYGAIDTVSRDKGGTVFYSVIGDADSVGLAPCAVLDAVSLMISEEIIDSDGIMADRDNFFVGEDIFVSQKDIRAVQSDKAKSFAMLTKLLEVCNEPQSVYLTGEVLAENGMRRMVELSAIPKELHSACFCRSTVEQGIINCLKSPENLRQLEKLIAAAEDITEQLYDGFDDLYIENLIF